MRKELVTFFDPKSPVSENFRTLRTNIQFMNTAKLLKTILITSTMPEEGKSWVASNLAVTFAQAGKKVIIIDADMRKGRLYRIFNAPPRPGLSNYLSNFSENQDMKIDNYIQPTLVENLRIIPAGNIPPNPSELLITKRMKNLLNELSEKADIVIIDGTPAKLVTDSIILSRIADATIIVSAHNETKKDDLKSITKDIKNVGGKLIGVVYNKIPITNKKYNQTYYYANTSRTRLETNVAEKKKAQQRAKNIIQKNEKKENEENRDNRNNWQQNLGEQNTENRNNNNWQQNFGEKNIEK